jgi:hypothetical protein
MGWQRLRHRYFLGSTLKPRHLISGDRFITLRRESMLRQPVDANNCSLTPSTPEPVRPRHPLARLATPPPSAITLVPPTHSTWPRVRAGQLAIGGCRTRDLIQVLNSENWEPRSVATVLSRNTTWTNGRDPLDLFLAAFSNTSDAYAQTWAHAAVFGLQDTAHIGGLDDRLKAVAIITLAAEAARPERATIFITALEQAAPRTRRKRGALDPRQPLVHNKEHYAYRRSSSSISPDLEPPR